MRNSFVVKVCAPRAGEMANGQCFHSKDNLTSFSSLPLFPEGFNHISFVKFNQLIFFSINVCSRVLRNGICSRLFARKFLHSKNSNDVREIIFGRFYRHVGC